MPNPADTWTVVATPKERYHLAVLLMHEKAAYKTDEQVSQLNRFRRALALVGPTEAYLDSKGGTMGLPPLATDRKTRNAFTVTREHADFIRKTLEKFDKNGVEVFLVASVLEQLAEHRTIAEDAAEAPVVASGAEDWEVPLPPMVGPPPQFFVWLGELLETYPSYGQLRAGYLHELEQFRAKQAGPGARRLAAVKDSEDGDGEGEAAAS